MGVISLIIIFFLITPLLGALASISILRSYIASGVFRGGAWNTPYYKATSFYRENSHNVSKEFCGFRCVKEN